MQENAVNEKLSFYKKVIAIFDISNNDKMKFCELCGALFCDGYGWDYDRDEDILTNDLFGEITYIQNGDDEKEEVDSWGNVIEIVGEMKKNIEK